MNRDFTWTETKTITFDDDSFNYLASDYKIDLKCLLQVPFTTCKNLRDVRFDCVEKYWEGVDFNDFPFPPPDILESITQEFGVFLEKYLEDEDERNEIKHLEKCVEKLFREREKIRKQKCGN